MKIEFQIPRWVLWLAAAVAAFMLATGAVFWELVKDAHKLYKPEFDIAALVLGPFATVASLYFGYRSKRELVERVAEFGSRAETDRRELTARAEEVVRLQRKADDATKLAKEKAAEVSATEQLVHQREERIDQLEADIVKVSGVGQIWKVRPPRPFKEFQSWRNTWHNDKSGAVIITTALFKGGVGKTHVAANFAAYLSEQQNKPVLLIDMDYQGSLSSMVLRAANRNSTGSKVDALLRSGAQAKEVFDQSISLAPALSFGSLIASDYSLDDAESNLLFGWVFDENSEIDPRYRLARLLLDPAVRNKFAAIIVDTPPRMTMGTLNALVASHYYLVPVILDRVSAEAVRPFLRTMAMVSRDMEIDLRLAGIISSRTREHNGLIMQEPAIREQIKEVTVEILGLKNDPMISRHIPSKAVIINDLDARLAYFLKDSKGRPLKAIYDEVFVEVWNRIMSGNPEEQKDAGMV